MAGEAHAPIFGVFLAASAQRQVSDDHAALKMARRPWTEYGNGDAEI